jgi:hypothetical protein
VTIRHEGERLVAEMRELVIEHATKVTAEVAGSLRAYLDPASGSLPVRLERLIKRSGELDTILAAHVGIENSPSHAHWRQLLARPARSSGSCPQRRPTVCSRQ